MIEVEEMEIETKFNNNRITVKDAKCILFHKLLCKDNNSLTDNEVEIMSFLVKDKEIQEVLEVGKKR